MDKNNKIINQIETNNVPRDKTIWDPGLYQFFVTSVSKEGEEGRHLGTAFTKL